MIVRHHGGSYEIRFGRLDEALGEIAGGFVLTDSNVRQAWGERFPGLVHEIPPGEASKSMEAYDRALQWLSAAGASRRSVLVAFGGGVVGDLAGFVAATYMRGMPLVQLPTSLLAMVDSSVGGKVGINLPHGKNLVGAFYPPTKVWICQEVLSTLPAREFSAGVAEIVKYGLIGDPQLLERLDSPLAPNAADLEAVIRACLEQKAWVVEEDEFETTGKRATLNFGHTVGHALEKVTGYGPLLHGEAVAIGMRVEAHLGEAIGLSAPGTAKRTEAVLQRQALPQTHPALSQADELIEAMRRDKKASGGTLSFSLLVRPGECKLVENVPSHAVEAALKACLI